MKEKMLGERERVQDVKKVEINMKHRRIEGTTRNWTSKVTLLNTTHEAISLIRPKKIDVKKFH